MIKPNPPDPSLISLSTTTYRLLLTFYPTRFRREYAPHMAQVFRDCCLNTYHQSGPPGMLSLWALTLFDWFKTVIEEQLNRGTDMTRDKFIRLSGWGMMLASVAMTFSFFSDSDAIRVRLYRLIGPPVTAEAYNAYRTFSENISDWLLSAAFTLLIVAVFGLRLRYGAKISTLGNNSLHLSIASGGVIIFVFIGDALVQTDHWWPVMWLGVTMFFAGLAGFGIDALRTKPMARENALPLLAGIWIPLLTLIEIFYEIITGTPIESWGWSTNIPFLITFISLLFLGYILQGSPANELLTKNES